MLISDVIFQAELATTPQERGKGLSGRESLLPKTGMLFTFESGVVSRFWMIDMLFPLDFVWISSECVVVDITAAVPAPRVGTPPSELELYTSALPASYTFEINAGEAATHGITVGAPVRFFGVPSEIGSGCQ